MTISERVAKEIEAETSIDRCRRKEDQAWDMAGLARQDGDTRDAQRHTEEARVWRERALQLNG